jgi:hypothetical protein
MPAHLTPLLRVAAGARVAAKNTAAVDIGKNSLLPKRRKEEVRRSLMAPPLFLNSLGAAWTLQIFAEFLEAAACDLQE